MEQPNNSAKFAFFYMLSLVALIFMALSTGMIIFQIINKNIVDAASLLPGSFDSGALKFAISSIIIAAPIYYVTVWQINKNLFTGVLNKDSGVRRWLTYFILFAASVVMIGWLIGTIYNYLDGDLTLRFALKSLTSIIIAAAVFTYYFYDIRRDSVINFRNRIIRIYFYGSLAAVLAALISAFFFIPSPSLVRAQKEDSQVLQQFDQIDSAINSYYSENKKLPASLDDLIGNKTPMFLQEETLANPFTKQKFDYKLDGQNIYQLCTTFKASNKINDQNGGFYYRNNRWVHDAGYQCLGQRVAAPFKQVPPVPMR